MKIMSLACLPHLALIRPMISFVSALLPHCYGIARWAGAKRPMSVQTLQGEMGIGRQSAKARCERQRDTGDIRANDSSKIKLTTFGHTGHSSLWYEEGHILLFSPCPSRSFGERTRAQKSSVLVETG